VLPSLDAQAIDYDVAREFPGWSDIWVQGERVFVALGEEPVVVRYTLAPDGNLIEDGRVSFVDYGSDTAAFWTNVLISDDKAYYFVVESREVVVWDPGELAITGSFELPPLEDRGALQPYLTTDRAAVLREDRLYVPVAWGNWDDYQLSEDSAILVIDTSTDSVLDTLPAACPDLNVATLDERGDIYFSDWVYGVASPAFDGTTPTCAVRIRAGEDVLDPEWSLRFADATVGRQAAALRYLGGGQALMSVYYDDRVTLTAETDRFAVVDAPNWRFWTSTSRPWQHPRSPTSAFTVAATTARASTTPPCSSCPPATTRAPKPLRCVLTAASNRAGRQPAG
jgi:hypothetical protein